jgi:hypothetical protein
MQRKCSTGQQIAAAELTQILLRISLVRQKDSDEPKKWVKRNKIERYAPQ